MNQPPPQAETILIEAAQVNANQVSADFDTWTVPVRPAIELQQGDELSVNTSFLEARGTNSDILEFSSKGGNQNNRQRIYFEYYQNDCGTNDINKARDWSNFQYPIAPATGLPENDKTYKPCKAFRYDRLMDESLIDANGSGFQRDVEGITYNVTKSTDPDPRVANVFNVAYREDYNVAGVFNSYQSTQEVTNTAPTTYMGGNIDGGDMVGARIDQENPNRADLTREDMSLTMNDWCINLDALPYWELRDSGDGLSVELLIPFDEAGTNYLSAIPRGTVIQIDWGLKRRQMSYYTGAVRQTDNDYVVSGSALNQHYKNYYDISLRTAYLCGHYVVYDAFEDTFGDDATGNDVNGNPFVQFGWAGRKAYGINFSKVGGNRNVPQPNGETPHRGWRPIRGATLAQIVNPNTSQSYKELETLGVNDAVPINFFIKKSPFYVGSYHTAQNEPGIENPDLSTFPLCRSVIGHQQASFSTADATLDNLYPKNYANPSHTVPMYVGSFKKINTSTGSSPTNPLDGQNQDLQYNSLNDGGEPGTNSFNLLDYWTANSNTPYAPLGHGGVYTLTATLPYNRYNVEMNFIPPTDYWEKSLIPINTIVVLDKGGVNEEMIYLSVLNDFGAVPIFDSGTGTWSATPNRMTIKILCRNLQENNTLFTGLPVGINPRFDRTSPNGWIDPAAGAWTGFHTHTIGTSVEWWDFREALSFSLNIAHRNMTKAIPRGLPILKNTGYWGSREPSENNVVELFPNIIDDDNFYSGKLKLNYSTGFSYYLYYNKQAGDVTYGTEGLPDSLYDENMAGLDSGKFGINRGGVNMLLLTQAIQQTSQQTYTAYNTPEIPTLTTQVRVASTSANPKTTGRQPFLLFNPHIYLWNMDMGAGEWEQKLLQMNPDGNGTVDPAPNNMVHRSHSRNFYIFSPDSFDMIDFTSLTLKKISNQGIDTYCGYVPLINQVEVQTPKDYLTPTDLSNYWTEQMHKTSEIICLLDGTVIKGSSARGVIQNELLQAVYGSWGNNNYPTATVLNRDYNTFPMTNGYALGSVLFLDGHEIPPDRNYGTGANVTHPITKKGTTFATYPRSHENLVHLWAYNEPFQLPKYTHVPIDEWETGGLVGGVLRTSAVVIPKHEYYYANYPIAPSGVANNVATSFPLPIDSQGFPLPDGTYPTGAVNPTLAPSLDYVPAAATLDQTANSNNRANPPYSAINTDGFGLWVLGADMDAPQHGTAGAREDPIYRETASYPLNYFKEETRLRYLCFSQYVGCDNMTLTYNTDVSAFEYQFLHQPFATTYSLEGGNESGGDNAVRIFDNVPKEVDNWEKYSGINVRNWASPIITRGELTYEEIQKTPDFLLTQYPLAAGIGIKSSLNPETDTDQVGERFMTKLGYKDSQFNPRTGTAVKGIEGIGFNTDFPLLYQYIPNGTTGSDTDVADAIINTSFSAEDNPNAESHAGLGQLIFYPSSGNSAKDQMSDTGVRYDYSTTQFGQRGGLKTNNHNKAMGFPNITGTPQVKDMQTFPRSLNPDGEQRSGYTVEIGSSPIRAIDLPVKLTDGYYYILCPTLIDDAQFYISANGGCVVPIIALVSKTYVSGDFYTTFQSPISFYCKQPKIITEMTVQIRNSSMGIPSNLGKNSSVIFSIRRYNPKIYSTPLTTSEKQDLAYKQLEMDKPSAKQYSIMDDFAGLGIAAMAVGAPPPGGGGGGEIGGGGGGGANYLQNIEDRINQHDIPNMTHAQRAQFYRTPEGQAFRAETAASIQRLQDMTQVEDQPSGLQLVRGVIEEQNRRATALAHVAHLDLAEHATGLHEASGGGGARATAESSQTVEIGKRLAGGRTGLRSGTLVGVGGIERDEMTASAYSQISQMRPTARQLSDESSVPAPSPGQISALTEPPQLGDVQLLEARPYLPVGGGGAKAKPHKDSGIATTVSSHHTKEEDKKP